MAFRETAHRWCGGVGRSAASSRKCSGGNPSSVTHHSKHTHTHTHIQRPVWCVRRRIRERPFEKAERAPPFPSRGGPGGDTPQHQLETIISVLGRPSEDSLRRVKRPIGVSIRHVPRDVSMCCFTSDVSRDDAFPLLTLLECPSFSRMRFWFFFSSGAQARGGAKGDSRRSRVPLRQAGVCIFHKSESSQSARATRLLREM